ncbi:MAG TPA: hypothetical protein VGC77_20765 [Rhodopseudomonas sp.]|uniref:hypothetical protein n=1 Tax=Rhodopseudomonas sp. TaxID=1078 RepID=UPI002EDB4285
MKSKDRKIRRIAAVQARLHRIAEWQLMECQAKESELDDRRRRIIEGFNDDTKLPELMAQVAGRSLRAASVEHGVVTKTRQRLAAQARDEARKLKQVLRKVHLLAGRAIREQEKRILEDEIDKSVSVEQP